MKRLKTFEGSLMPLWQKDFDFMQDGVKEALGIICQQLGLGRDNFIISGCAITETNTTLAMASGWAWFDGEVLPVRAMEATAKQNGISYVKLTRVTSYNQGGTRDVTTSGTSATQDAWQDDYLQPSPCTQADVLATTTPALAVRSGFWTLADRLQKAYTSEDSGIGQLALNNNGNRGAITSAIYRKIGASAMIVVNLDADFPPNIEGPGYSDYTLTGAPTPAIGFEVQQENVTATLSSQGTLTLRLYESTNKASCVMLSYVSPSATSGDGHLVAAQGQGGGSGGGTDI